MTGIEALRIIRYGAFALIGVLALGWAAVGLGLIDVGKRAPAVRELKIGSPVVVSFKLSDQEGRPVSEADIKGRPTVLFFGFTYCPDVCPTTLASLTAIMSKMGAEAADKLAVFMVSVDPERDTPGELKQYLSSFDPRIRALTGAPDQIAAIAAPLKIYYAKVAIEGGGYTMDHDAAIYLIDAKGGFAGTIAYGEDATTAQAKLERLANGAP
jgi:protein SCO1/2